MAGTNIRAHQKAAGASRKGDLQKSETAVKRLADLVAAAPAPDLIGGNHDRQNRSSIPQGGRLQPAEGLA